MTIPLYTQEKHTETGPSKGNKGLFFSRFFNQYSQNWSVSEGAKNTFLNYFTSFCGSPEQLNQACIRQLSLCNAINGQVKVFKLTSHFVTGLGNEHPVENGFLWHHTLGVPYISGSQVKGLLRSLVENYFAGTPEEKKRILHAWFGSESKDPKACEVETQAGRLICFDAIPVSRPELMVEIMTPHYGKWYEKGGKISSVDETTLKEIAPADWHEPIPIPFLTVKNASFLFSFAVRPVEESSGDKIELTEIMNVLSYALEQLGAGAKTQTGFGYMQEDEKALDKLKEEMSNHQKQQEQAVIEAEEALLNPQQATFYKAKRDGNWKDDKDAFNRELPKQLDLLEEHWDKGVLDELITLFKGHFAKAWNNPNDKKVKEGQKKAAERLLILQKKQG